MESLNPPLCTDEDLAKIQPLKPLAVPSVLSKQDMEEVGKLTVTRVVWFLSGIGVGFILSWLL